MLSYTKNIFFTLLLLVSVGALARPEQCSVDKKDSKKTAVTSINLPESKKGRLSLNGYNLACDNAVDGWCKFKVTVNREETIFTISDTTELVLEKKIGKTRKGIFNSAFYTKGKVGVTCKTPTLVRHN